MDIQELLIQITIWGSAIVGASSLVVQALAMIADVTPNTKDDEYAGKAKRFIGQVSAFFDRFAMNLPADKARRK